MLACVSCGFHLCSDFLEQERERERWEWYVHEAPDERKGCYHGNKERGWQEVK